MQRLIPCLEPGSPPSSLPAPSHPRDLLRLFLLPEASTNSSSHTWPTSPHTLSSLTFHCPHPTSCGALGGRVCVLFPWPPAQRTPAELANAGSPLTLSLQSQDLASSSQPALRTPPEFAYSPPARTSWWWKAFGGEVKPPVGLAGLGRHLGWEFADLGGVLPGEAGGREWGGVGRSERRRAAGLVLHFS